ncbi:hypothetical protein [Nonomuraea pusilla]|uniref:Uncharacterized protein n=1 Tax=Nonomuraea pusilla TaxID=46177 RepID=A0A1H8K7X5_9ACTN|nr:hypothetical protein [Nonomuraea pusilla]SEN89034.1 hypothetical protein SAMN05660976_08545 [Nonomuraea pusilla]
MSIIEQAMPKLPAPVRVGQATAVEQSRAVAEVHAAIVVAQQCPRDVQAARLDIQNSCSQMSFAEQAFFRYKRSSSTISGPTIHMARELARCWGNVQYGIAEMSRDDEHGQSEMMAFAWDVQTNSRSSTTFIVPHKRDTSDGTKPIVDMRDIYENNANMGARRVREMIFAILPPWLVEEAKELCNKTLAGGGDKPLAVRVDEALVGFAGLGVAADRLEQKLGRPKEEWNGYDVAQLRVIYRSIQRREVTVEDEFPAPKLTAAQVVGSPQPAETAEEQPEASEVES